MNRIVGIAAAASAFVVVLSAEPARAQHGALAYDADNRIWGRATNADSPREAERVALSYCRSAGCRVVVRTGPGECGAIAAARYSTRYHWSTRYTRREAELAAVEGCREESGQRCELIVVQCNE